MKKPYREKYLLVFVVVFSILFTISLSEVLLRGAAVVKDFRLGRRIAVLSTNQELGYELRLNFTHNLLQTNSYGFRGREFNIIKKKDVYRIVIIGDSIPFGIKMEEKDIFPVLLQKSIQDDSFLNKEVEVINGGIGGYNIWQYLELYKTKISNLSPDMIIVSICQNDFEKSGPYYTDMWGMVRGGELERRTNGSFLNRFYLYRTLTLAFRSLKKMKMKSCLINGYRSSAKNGRKEKNHCLN